MKKMDKIKLVPCIVCEVPWPKQALDKLGVDLQTAFVLQIRIV